MAWNAKFRCPLCSQCGADKFSQVLSHIQHFHFYDPHFSITCGVDGCQVTYRNFNSYKSHLQRKHRAATGTDSVGTGSSPNEIEDTGMETDVGEDQSINDDSGPILLEKHQLQTSAAKFLMNIRDGMCLSQRATDAVVQGGKGLVSGMLHNLHQIVRGKVEDGASAEEIDQIFMDPTLTNPFDGLETRYQQHKFFQENFQLIEPVERCLGHCYVRRQRNGKSKLIKEGEFCYDVDVLKSLEALINIDPVMEQIQNSHQRNDGLMADICDGPGVSDHPLFGQDQHALQIILYYDDVELCNPLGANTKKHKLGVFYYTLGNLRPESRSLLHTIQLVALVKTRYINKYGICKILEPFMESVLKLEEGYSFTVKGTEEVFFGSLLLVCADNLAAQFIGGFKTLSAAMRKCRYCLATDPELQTQFVAESFHARSREEHKGYVELLDGPAPEYMATTYGVVFDSVLNRSKYFHVVDGLAPDVMHDILEGVLSYCTKLLLKSLILEEKLFRLQDINARIESFDYGYQAATSKPSVIAHSKLTTGDTAGLGQSASKMWCLCRYLPVLIGAWIPEDHWKYGLFLLLLKMLDIIMAPVVTVHKAVFLRQLISEHHELFCELYPMATITPKMHYMIHLPIWILRYGPMSHIWCMRFEARHKLLKRLSTTMCNFVNISKSLANRFQQYMCYQQLNEENYLKQDVSVPRTIRKCITDLGYNSCLMDRLQLENPEIEVAASAEISGITYKRGCCVVTGYFDDLPEFGEIQQIVCHKSVVYLVVELLKTVQFDDHFHCFEVSLRTDDVWKVLLHSELHDYNVLHKNSIVDLSGQPLTVIVAKYDLEDR